MTIDESLKQALEPLMPKSLDDIIRSNREKARLYLSTEAALDALPAPVPPGPITGTLSAWAFITTYFTDPGVAMVNLTGFNDAENASWMTSQVMAIDGDRVFTRSGSHYRLEGERSDILDLPYICATLNSWGVGQRLGVPPFFF